MASDYMVVKNVGLRHSRIGSLGPPSDQRLVARHQHCAGLPGLETDDGDNLAKFFCGRAVRIPSVAGAISRMDFRTKRRAQHVFLDADDLGVRAVCRESPDAGPRHQGVVWVGAVLFHPGFDEQDHAGHLAFCITAA